MASDDPKVYIASPLGFTESGREWYSNTLIPAVIAVGFQVLDPWTLTDPAEMDRVLAMPLGDEQRLAYEGLNHLIARNNVGAIDDCNALLAVLDGVDVDSGVAWEMGYAYAQHIPIIGYRGDFRLASENIGTEVNLQVRYCVRGHIARNLDQLAECLSALHEELMCTTLSIV